MNSDELTREIERIKRKMFHADNLLNLAKLDIKNQKLELAKDRIDRALHAIKFR